jgi:hypothetical protein
VSVPPASGARVRVGFSHLSGAPQLFWWRAAGGGGAPPPPPPPLQPRAQPMASTTTAASTSGLGAGGRSSRSVNTFPLVAPSVVVLFLWMIVPLVMTLWFSFQYYNLLDPTVSGFAGFENYTYLLTDPSLWTAMLNTLYLVFWVLVITVGLGTLLAVLFDQDFYGRGVARLFAIAPFFVMPKYLNDLLGCRIRTVKGLL